MDTVQWRRTVISCYDGEGSQEHDFNELVAMCKSPFWKDRWKCKSVLKRQHFYVAAVLNAAVSGNLRDSNHSANYRKVQILKMLHTCYSILIIMIRWRDISQFYIFWTREREFDSARMAVETLLNCQCWFIWLGLTTSFLVSHGHIGHARHGFEMLHFHPITPM